MATKLFCDRCGDESGPGDARNVRPVSISGKVTPETLRFDLCGVCHEALLRLIKDGVVRAGTESRR